MDFTNIVSEDEMIDYIKVKCGMPILNQELTSDMYKVSIADTVLEYRRQGSAGEGNFTEYCLLTLSAGTSFYHVSGCRSLLTNSSPVNVESVSNIEMTNDLTGLNNLFTAEHILLIENQALMNGNNFGPMINTQGSGQVLSTYTTAMMYLEEIQKLFNHTVSVKFLKGKNMLQMVPTPNIGGICVVQLTQGAPASELYNLPTFRKLALGRALEVYARVLGKYSGTLPDGLSINFQDVRTESKELIQEALAELKSEREPCDFFIG